MSTLDLPFDMLEVPANGVASARVKQLKIAAENCIFRRSKSSANAPAWAVGIATAASTITPKTAECRQERTFPSFTMRGLPFSVH